MKNSGRVYRCTDNHVEECMEGKRININHKSNRSGRLISTQFTEVVNMQLEKWHMEDAAAADSYEFAVSLFG